MPGLETIYEYLTKGGYGLATLFIVWGFLNRRERIAIQKAKDEDALTFRRQLKEMYVQYDNEKKELQKSVLDLATSHYTNSVVNINELKNTVSSLKDAISEMIRYLMKPER